MFHIITILLSAVIISGCQSPVQYSVSPELQPYVNTFLSNAKARNMKLDLSALSISMEQTQDTSYLGKCTKGTRTGIDKDGTYRTWVNKDVRINSYYWINLNPIAKDVLIHHELAHCLLNREHDIHTVQFPDNMYHYKSIMNPENIALYSRESMLVKQYWSYYVNELFTFEINFDNILRAYYTN